MAKICPNCRQHNADTNHACAECGTSLADAEITTLPPTVDEDAPLESQMPLAPPAPPEEGPAGEEKLLWSGRASYKTMIGHWALYVVGLVGVLVLALTYGLKGAVAVLVWLLVILPGLYLLFKTLYLRWSVGYRLTEQRLFTDRGIIGRLTDQTELIRVDDVRVRKGPVQRLMGVGDVIVISTDATDGEQVIRGIENPDEVAEHIRNRMRKLRKGGLYIENL